MSRAQAGIHSSDPPDPKSRINGDQEWTGWTHGTVSGCM